MMPALQKSSRILDTAPTRTAHHNQFITREITKLQPPIAFLIPPTHFWHYTRFEIKHVTKGEMIEYYDPLDKYSFAFPNTRQFDQPPLSYGSVNVSPSDAPDVTISVERWQL